MSEFGAKLTEWREKAGLSRAELERAIDKGRNYVQRIEQGGRSELPDRATCDAIATAIRVDPATVWASALVSLGREDIRQYYELREHGLREDYEALVDAAKRVTPEERDLLAEIRLLGPDGARKALDLFRSVRNAASALGAPDTSAAIVELMDTFTGLDHKSVLNRAESERSSVYGAILCVLRVPSASPVQRTIRIRGMSSRRLTAR